ncbi:hypothetical protein [Rufibacter quisquiliarum]|uniref:Metallo-beta-lactamase domain-containing protein n=1 Tax=Rufibacter quisquiliarum TaxID=1549639 RepID=A0A839GJY1_9BACT|nr:hypothetical protein [Rufibacter quisquiliarum]MBA9077089.1 hypothetical protein [Rufibacter quisquiliarum]
MAYTRINLLKQCFTLHPVGQGFFYSGVVTAEGKTGNSNPFKFVFDCGSMTKGAGYEEADTFRRNYLEASGRLDMLVVSHFDGDHVNQIGTLLQRKVKVDHLILPFTLFEERLFLVLKHFLRKGVAPADEEREDSFFIQFVLDPLGTLRENLDGDSTVYLVTGDPRPASEGSDGDGKGFPGRKGRDTERTDAPRMDFGFGSLGRKATAKDRVFFGTKAMTVSEQLRIVKDSEKGYIHLINEGVNVMEFLFYRRRITKRERVFYKDIFQRFCAHFGIKNGSSPEAVQKEILEKLRSLRGGTTLRKKIYWAAITVFAADLEILAKDAENLNTTALSMLHLNPTYYESLAATLLPHGQADGLYYQRRTGLIQKFDGTNKTRIEHNLFPYHSFHGDYEPYYDRDFFPNCLLTSDSFLLHQTEVDAFFHRYQAYWQRFWLFQIPHHGSKKNANRNLFTRVNRSARKFINYGIHHWALSHYSHPDPEIFDELRIAGCCSDIIAVNEYLGFHFSFTLSAYQH